MKTGLQSELISSIAVMIVMAIFFWYAGRKVKEADPMKKPKGVVLIVEIYAKFIYDYLRSLMPKKYEKNYYPYFAYLFLFLILSNIWGLTGFDAPTSCYSITLAMGLITFGLIQWNAIQYQGLGPYIKGKLIPPTELLGMVSPLISLSMRLFCNILSGSFIMSLVYQFTSYLSNHLIPFNFLGPILAPVLHCYFDLFSGVIQALVFLTLSTILISIENPDEENA